MGGGREIRCTARGRRVGRGEVDQPRLDLDTVVHAVNAEGLTGQSGEVCSVGGGRGYCGAWRQKVRDIR
jgi:hypothetical protein